MVAFRRLSLGLVHRALLGDTTTEKRNMCNFIPAVAINMALHCVALCVIMLMDMCMSSLD